MSWIIHVDMDEFFAAVEKLDHPEYRGKPLLIGGDPKGRGVVATASYEARPFGCHSAMPMATAIRLCPQAIVLPVRMERYHELSERIFEVLERFSPLVEPLSVDEAFLDVTGCEGVLGPPPEIGRKIKQAIRADTGLTASVGVAPNMFLAKLASDLKKPDALVVITEQDKLAILHPLSVRKLWGVGPAGEKELAKLNVQTIGQVARLGEEFLRRRFGAWGEHIWRLSMGMDDRQVSPGGAAKSIGAEETFAKDVAGLEELEAVLLGQVQEVARRLREQGYLGKTINLKIRYGDFTTLSRSHTLDDPTDIAEDIWQQARGILRTWAAKDFRPLRLLGLSVKGLTHAAGRQLPLFPSAGQLKQERIDKAMDRIAEKFGADKLRRGLVGRGDANSD